MERFTISLDEELAKDFDALISARGYRNRSEAVRDMLRRELESSRGGHAETRHCVANLSYIYNHHERELAERLTHLQHDHHHLTISTLHAHLDHDNCIECVILHGPMAEVRQFADALISERGVRHGALNVVSVDMGQERHSHPRIEGNEHGGSHSYRHAHIKPKN